MCHTEVHLQPRPRTTSNHPGIWPEVTPTPDSLLSREDYFGNEVTFFSIAEPHRELIITSRCVADLEAVAPPALELSPPWEQVREEVAKRDTPETFEAGQFVFESPSIRVGAPFAQYAAASFPKGRPLLSAVEDLSRRIYTEFHYDKRATTIGTPVDEVLDSRRGVCQDFAHLMIACLRSLGLARALHERLCPDRRRFRGRGSFARLGFGLVSGVWLAGFRSHQQRDAAGGTFHRRVGARLFRRHAR